MPTLAATALHSVCFSHQKPIQPQQENKSLLFATKPQSVLHKHPLYTPVQANVSLEFKEKIICLEVMGIDAGKALSMNPLLHTTSLDSMNTIISFLISKGIRQRDLRRIFGMCPKILTSNIRTELNPVFEFLKQELGVPETNFRKVIVKCPRLLVSSVRDQLKPALFYLQRLGFSNMGALAYQNPVLLVSSVEYTLIPKFRFLEGIGFSKDEAIAMVLRCPALFTYSIDNNFKPKYQYFAEEIKRDIKELEDFPQYFAFSLENRIKPRHVVVAQSGVKMSLPLMLRSTEDEFWELIDLAGGSQ